jgi:hypothetical protein
MPTRGTPGLTPSGPGFDDVPTAGSGMIPEALKGHHAKSDMKHRLPGWGLRWKPGTGLSERYKRESIYFFGCDSPGNQCFISTLAWCPFKASGIILDTQNVAENDSISYNSN